MAAAGVIDDFVLPPHLEATEPPEARGLKRDEVRLLVSRAGADTIEHARFRDLPAFLSPGDVLVVNTSGTINAALAATGASGDPFELHLSTQLPGRFWVVELRQPGPSASLPYRGARPGTVLHLPEGGRAILLAPYPLAQSLAAASRLWMAALELPQPVLPYLDRFGLPIRYSYLDRQWPTDFYQTVFAIEPGSAEMPSAARPFTPELVTRLVARGIQIAPLLLHTGVASLEDHEPPYEEFYRVPADTAARINAARARGHRIVAVGTTVVRALETVADERGSAHPGEGWTNLVITRERQLRLVNGLITGLHEPRATHLAMVERVVIAAGGTVAHLERAYAEARAARFLWHEFGDSHLVID
jgi:S-adenosylmethionine:tRNA ribosyltransferase-isomerase